jgi:membrane protease subunit (stomatin/prohibitin family)
MVKIQSVFAKTMEARELSKVEVGGAFTAIKSFEVLNSAAENTGSGNELGAMLGAGIGLGAGLPLGQQIAQTMQLPTSKSSAEDPMTKLRTLKSMLDEGLITQEIFEKKRDQIVNEI